MRSAIGTQDVLTYDPSGEYASRGKVSMDWLKEILKRDTYLAKKPPKSTGREIRMGKLVLP